MKNEPRYGLTHAPLSGHAGDAGQLVVGWQPGRYAAAEIRPLIDSKPIANEHCHSIRRGERESLAIDYVLRSVSTEIEIVFSAATPN